MGEKRKVLGRGLDTLLPSRPVVHHPAHPAEAAGAAAAPAHPPGENVRDISVDVIDPNPYQPRTHMDDTAIRELAASITVAGVLQPITVRPLPNGRFQLIAGHRRWLASRLAQKPTVPAIVRRVSNEQAMEMTIIENLQREDLNPIEQATAFDRLGRDFGLTQEQIAQRTGKERATVANYLRLLKLPKGAQEMLEGGDLTLGHAKALLALSTREDMMDFATDILERDLTVRETEEMVAAYLQPAPSLDHKEKVRVVDPNVREAEKAMERALGVRVKISDRKGKGKVVLEYATLEDFDRIMEAVVGGRG